MGYTAFMPQLPCTPNIGITAFKETRQFNPSRLLGVRSGRHLFRSQFVQLHLCQVSIWSFKMVFLLKRLQKRLSMFWEQMVLSELLENIHVLNALKNTRQLQMLYPALVLQPTMKRICRLTIH